MAWDPDDAVAVVTGASSGIGRCLCELLVARGANVVAVARRQERLDDLVQACGVEKLIPVTGDVTDPQLRAQVVQAAVGVRGGRVDLLVNNAGIGAIGPFMEATEQRLREIMEVNFFAPVELIRSLVPHLRAGRQPVICNIGSVLGHRAVPDKSEYCASKFALHGFSDSLRAELASDGIQVTLVSPSTTRSEFFESLIETDARDAVQKRRQLVAAARCQNDFGGDSQTSQRSHLQPGRKSLCLRRPDFTATDQ